MMGDNRDNSTDSRFVRYVGFVPHENLVGPAQILFFLLMTARGFGKFGAGRFHSPVTSFPFGALMASLDALQETLGHSFADVKLLQRALRHASLNVDDDNEALEFIGDRVLGLAISQILMARYAPSSKVRYRAASVNWSVVKAAPRLPSFGIWAPI